VKVHRFALSLSLLAAAAGAQPPAPAPGPQPMVRRMRPPPPVMTGTSAELDIQLVNGMPTILATVNGRGPYRFGVDTGAAGYLRLSPAVVQALALQQTGEAMAGDPSGRNPIRISVYRVDSLAFGGLGYSGVSTTPLPDLGPRTAGLDGIVGIGFFEALLLTIDYGRLRFTAAPGALPPADGREVVEATLDRGLISVPARIGEAAHMLHLDTGNTAHPLFLPAEAIPSLPTRGEPRMLGRARTVSQVVEVRALELTVPVSVGTTRLPVTSVGYPAVAPPGNIGSLALVGMAVTVDYANRRVRIVPSQR
jgi:hypothetical protein